MTAETAHGELHVVVIDDDYYANAGMSRLLESAGFHVTGRAYDGLAGLALIKATQPHVAIVDIEMPALDGFQLARQISMEVESPPFLIAITGTAKHDSVYEAAGFDAHLGKPVDWPKLEVLLASLCQRAIGHC